MLDGHGPSRFGSAAIMPDGAPHCKPRGQLLSPGVEQQVVRALGSIGSATLLSRLLGYVRDMVVALAFGAGPVTDAFFVAFRIPNILRPLLGEGALATPAIPPFSGHPPHPPRPHL